MSSTFIRLMLAMAMVLWSPAWCCCALRAAAAHALDEATSEGIIGSCCSRAPAPPQQRSCCDDGEESTCQCNDRPSELNRLDTAPKLVAPSLERMAVVETVFILSADDQQISVRVRDAAYRRCHPPPSKTLLAQHCLLLV